MISLRDRNQLQRTLIVSDLNLLASLVSGNAKVTATLEVVESTPAGVKIWLLVILMLILQQVLRKVYMRSKII